MEGTFLLQRDNILRILVGQRGESADPSRGNSGGGGGGTFVVLTSPLTPLIVAGGGGGGNGDGSASRTNTNPPYGDGVNSTSGESTHNGGTYFSLTYS